MRVLLLFVLLSVGTAYSQCMDSLWRQAPGTEDGDMLVAMINSEDGNGVAAGYVEFATAPWFARGHIRKLNPLTGDAIWSHSFVNLGSQDVFQDVKLTTDGGYICAGNSRTPISLTQNYWLMKVNGNGDSLWSRTFGNGFGLQGRCVAQAPDGGYGIAGRAVQLPNGFGGTDWLVVKTNANGDSLWSVLIGDSSSETVTDMLTTSLGDFLVVGYSDTDTSRNGQAALISQTGQVLWNRYYTFDISQVIWAVVERPGGRFWVTGSIQPPNGTNAVLLAEIDANGDVAWSRRLELLVDHNDEAFAIHPDDHGGAYLFGTGYPTTNQDAQAFVAHVSRCGELLSSRFLGDGYAENIRGGTYLANRLVMCGSVTLENAEMDMLLYGLSADSCNGAPCSFNRTAPQDSSLINWSQQTRFAWSEAEDPDGDPVSYIFHLEHDYMPGGVSPVDTVVTDPFVDVSIDIPVVPLDDVYDFHWRVWATDGQDTAEAMNGEGYFRMDIPESAEDLLGMPHDFSLSAYPNPFNPTTTLSFTLDAPQEVSLALYDVQGRLAQQLLNELRNAGTHSVTLNGSALPSGIYFARLNAGAQSRAAKLVLMK